MKIDLKTFEEYQDEYRRQIWDRADRRNLDLRLPKSQFSMPRIHINTSDDGETTLLLDYGLPCCGLSIVLECPETFDLAFMRAFIEKTSEMREWLKDNYFSSCAIAENVPVPVLADSAQVRAETARESTSGKPYNPQGNATDSRGGGNLSSCEIPNRETRA